MQPAIMNRDTIVRNVELFGAGQCYAMSLLYGAIQMQTQDWSSPSDADQPKCMLQYIADHKTNLKQYLTAKCKTEGLQATQKTLEHEIEVIMAEHPLPGQPICFMIALMPANTKEGYGGHVMMMIKKPNRFPRPTYIIMNPDTGSSQASSIHDAAGIIQNLEYQYQQMHEKLYHAGIIDVTKACRELSNEYEAEGKFTSMNSKLKINISSDGKAWKGCNSAIITSAVNKGEINLNMLIEDCKTKNLLYEYEYEKSRYYYAPNNCEVYNDKGAPAMQRAKEAIIEQHNQAEEARLQMQKK